MDRLLKILERLAIVYEARCLAQVRLIGANADIAAENADQLRRLNYNWKQQMQPPCNSAKD